MTHALTTTTAPCASCNTVRDFVRREIGYDKVTNHYRCATCGRVYESVTLVKKEGK